MEENRPTYVLPAMSMDDDELVAAMREFGSLDEVGTDVVSEVVTVRTYDPPARR